MYVVLGILEVVSNPWRFILGNWFCDSDLDNPTGIDRVLTEKDLLANSYSNLEASILDEKEFLLLKVISTLLNYLLIFTPVFGVPIEVTAQRQDCSKPIPQILVKCGDYLIVSGSYF